jgi:hypothetical protein
MKTDMAPHFFREMFHFKFHENPVGTSQELFQAYRQMDGLIGLHKRSERLKTSLKKKNFTYKLQNG